MAFSDHRRGFALARDLVGFVLKLAVDAARDVVMIPLSIFAAGIDFALIRRQEPRYFRAFSSTAGAAPSRSTCGPPPMIATRSPRTSTPCWPSSSRRCATRPPARAARACSGAGPSGSCAGDEPRPRRAGLGPPALSVRAGSVRAGSVRAGSVRAGPALEHFQRQRALVEHDVVEVLQAEALAQRLLGRSRSSEIFSWPIL
jgi:hypothetical protein